MRQERRDRPTAPSATGGARARKLHQGRVRRVPRQHRTDLPDDGSADGCDGGGWTVTCSCGWEANAGSRADAADAHSAHRVGAVRLPRDAARTAHRLDELRRGRGVGGPWRVRCHCGWGRFDCTSRADAEAAFAAHAR